MPAAGVVMIVAVVLIIAALVYFLVIFILASGVRAFSERWRRKILA